MFNTASGLGLLLKSFGINPEELMAQVETARTATLAMVKHFDERLQRIEAKQDAILAMLDGAAVERPGADRGGAGLGGAGLGADRGGGAGPERVRINGGL